MSARYKMKRVNGKLRYEHVVIYINAHGEIPDGMVVHHINMNKKDNSLENLVCLTKKEHDRLHAAMRKRNNGRFA